MSNQENNLIVGLDIGTSKVVVAVGQVNADKSIDVVGVGSHPSKGLKKGNVVDIEATVSAIQCAVEEAELMAGCQIHSVFAGISGSHIEGLSSHGVVAIKDGEVDRSDMDRVFEAAQAVAIPADRKVLHVLPQEYEIDGQQGIREPLGMPGVRLEVNVHIVTGSVNAEQNIAKCIRRCDIGIEELVLQQLASSYSVLSEDEKEQGVCLIDIGGGTTDIAVFHQGAIRYTAVIPVGGDQVTNDIATVLRVSCQEAEEIKLEHACALSQLIKNDETFKLTSVGDRPARVASREAVAEVVEPRYEELFTLIGSELRRVGLYDELAAGIVITGGSAKIEGAVELGEEIFNLPVRLGMPDKVVGTEDIVNNPIYATSVGLLIYGQKQQDGMIYDRARGDHIRGMFDFVKSWFKGNF